MRAQVLKPIAAVLVASALLCGPRTISAQEEIVDPSKVRGRRLLLDDQGASISLPAGDKWVWRQLRAKGQLAFAAVETDTAQHFGVLRIEIPKLDDAFMTQYTEGTLKVMAERGRTATGLRFAHSDVPHAGCYRLEGTIKFGRGEALLVAYITPAGFVIQLMSYFLEAEPASFRAFASSYRPSSNPPDARRR